MLHAVVAACILHAAPTPSHEVILLKSSVQTHYVTPKGKQSGSGTVIKVTKDRLYVLSCHHVTHREKDYTGKLTVVTCDGVHRPARLHSMYEAADLSLIEVKLTSACDAWPVLMARDEAYKSETPIRRCGYPKGGPRTVVNGSCLGYTGHYEDRPDIVSSYMSPGAIPGDSGGGVFRQKDLRLIGVVYATGPFGMSVARLENVRKLLKVAEVELE